MKMDVVKSDAISFTRRLSEKMDECDRWENACMYILESLGSGQQFLMAFREIPSLKSLCAKQF